MLASLGTRRPARRAYACSCGYSSVGYDVYGFCATVRSGVHVDAEWRFVLRGGVGYLRLRRKRGRIPCIFFSKRLCNCCATRRYQ